MAATDLQLSDGFHKTKRSTLVFSVLLLATYVPGVKAAGTAGLLGLSFAGVDIAWVRFAVWGAAAYYYVGFISEFLANRRANAEALAESAAGDFTRLARIIAHNADNALKHVGARLAAIESELPKSTADIDKLQSYSSGLRSAIERSLEALSGPQDTNRAGALRLHTRKQYEHQLTETNDRISQLDRSLEAASTGVRGRLDEIHLQLHTLMGDLERLDKDLRGHVRSLRKLTTSAMWERNFLFYGWELAGASAPVLAATYLLVTREWVGSLAGMFG